LVLPLAGLLLLSIMVQSGFTPAAVAHLADITEEHAGDRGAIMGLYSVFLGLGQFLGSSLGGPFVDWLGADGIIVITVLFGLLAAAMLLRLFAQEARLPALPEHALGAEELLSAQEPLGRS
jgi:predicted MFS family arabinose efflux permease